jgi:hypothetical protein
MSIRRSPRPRVSLRRSHGLLRLAVVAAVLTLGAVTGAARPAHADDPTPCTHGGFASFTDPSTSQPFTNQGQCARVVAPGGTLLALGVGKAPPSPGPVTEGTIGAGQVTAVMK